MEKESKLTIKQRKWLQLYLQNGNATESAMQVYTCKDRDVAKSIGSENLSKLDFGDAMEEFGINDQKLLATLKEGLEAWRITPIGDAPDFGARHKFMETGLKLKGRLVDKSEVEHKGEVSTRIIFDVRPSTDVQRYRVLKDSESPGQTASRD